MDADEIQERNDQRDILEYLTESEMLSGPAHGIALQVLEQGQECLKGNQISVFEQQIVEKYFNLDCSRCSGPMPTSEIRNALEEDDGLCSWCRKMDSNDD